MDHAAAKKGSVIPGKANADTDDHRKTSGILKEIAHLEASSLSVKELSEKLGDRGFGLILLLFGLPNTIPLPIPGVSTVTGPILLFFAAQLCFGRDNIWLPEWVAKRNIRMSIIQPFIHKSLPWLIRLEHYCKPRLEVCASRTAERISGGLILVLSGLMALPIPLGNLPPGIAISLLALAITERDGVLMIIGWISSVIALVYLCFLIGGYAWVLWRILETILPL